MKMHLKDNITTTINRSSVEQILISYAATTILPAAKSNLSKICENNSSKHKPTSSHDALLYIVVVLLFYACSMVILMVKYVRREKEEAEMAHYYSEFVARDRFKSPKYQIKQYMKSIANYKKEKETVDDSEDFVSCLDVEAADDRFIIGKESNI